MIGNARELLKISSQPIEEHAYLFTSFDEFEKFARRALHEDLSPGTYAQVKNSNMCNYLCTNSSDEVNFIFLIYIYIKKNYS